MARSGTEISGEWNEAAPIVPLRALTLVEASGPQQTRYEPYRSPVRNRTPAGFVTQLILGADPGLRPSRLARTRDAAALYAKAARLLA